MKTPFAEKLALREPWLVAAMALLLFLLNMATARHYPAFGFDDVLLSDAGVNLALGNGFTSSAWPGQAKHEFFSGNLPLYPLALSGWLRTFGFGYLQLRTFSYLCGSLALLCVWWAVRRRDWLRSAGLRLACVGVMFLSAPVFIALRRNRYDAFQLLLCAAVLALCASRIRPRLKAAALFLVAALLAAAGFQAAVFVGLMSVAVVLWTWIEESEEFLPAFRATACIGAGLALGGMAVFALYWREGVLHGLAANVAWGRSLDAATPAQASMMQMKRIVWDSLRDSAMMPLLGLVLLPLTQATLRRSPEIRRGVLWALIVTIAVVLILEAVVHFADYYRWMTAVPLTLLAFRLWQSAAPALSPWRRRAGQLAFACVALAGMPARLTFSALMLPYADQSRRVEQLAAQHVRRDDVVFVDCQAYFAVKPVCAQTYSPMFLGKMTPEEEESVNVLVIREVHAHHWAIINYGEYLQRFSRAGRKWDRVGSAPLERTWFSTLLARYFPERVDRYEFYSGAWDIHVYRRVK